MKIHTIFVTLCSLTLAVAGPVQNSLQNSDAIKDDVNREKEVAYSSICYGELGCFDDSIGGRLPGSPDDIPPFYVMCSNKNPEVTMSWNDTVDDLRKKTEGFLDDKERELIFLAHGFMESLQDAWIRKLKNAILVAYPNATVMMIDWGLGATGPLIMYDQASANVPLIANMTVRLTSKLMEIKPSIKAEKIYFIGFSLGAQMAGYYARSFANETGTKIGRITSLEAAHPDFEEMGIAPRVGDADFVEAIHTSVAYGYNAPYADIDFYANGGYYQPGCNFYGCSHDRAFVYLTSALKNLDTCQFRGVRCDTVKAAYDAQCNGTLVDAYIGQKDLQNYPRLDDNFHIVYVKTEAWDPFCPKPSS